MPNKALALALSTHPGPTIAVTMITVVLGVGVGLEPARYALLGLAVLLGQASVGLSNDWLDADRDREVGRRDKPVAAGLIRTSVARNVAVLTAVLAIALTAPLGFGATMAHAAFIASAWAYNVKLKSTVFSILPYLVSFGLLPLIVTLSLSSPAFAASWAMLLGALLGAAAHFANVLPDLIDDQRTGIRGLPHRLGRRTSTVAAFILLVVAAAVGLLGPAAPPTLAQWIGFTVIALITIVGITLSVRGRLGRLSFRLIIVAALVTVAMLVASGAELIR